MKYLISCVDENNIKKYQETIPYSLRFSKIKHQYGKYFGIVELETMFDLLELTKKVGKVIISENEIEIYDDYRE